MGGRSPQHSRRDAFSLVEMLTAVAILALLFSMLGGILGTMSRTWKEGQQRANNFTKARSMLDLVARDLQAGLYRPDINAFEFPASPAGAVKFYTQRPGVMTGTNVRDISLVQYQLNTTANGSTLQRGDSAYDWSVNSSSNSTQIAFNNTALPNVASSNFRDISPGIVAFKLLFVYSNGTMSTVYTPSNQSLPNPVTLKAIGIAIAVVDDQAMDQLAAKNQIQALRTSLETATTGSKSVKTDWDTYLNGTFNWNTYPKSLATGLRIFERYVYLPSTY